jgi:hypothetical protein
VEGATSGFALPSGRSILCSKSKQMSVRGGHQHPLSRLASKLTNLSNTTSSQDATAGIQMPATLPRSPINVLSKKRSASEAAYSFESPSKLSKHATPHTSPSQSGSSSKKRPGSRKKGPIRLSFASGTFSG